MRWRSKGAGLLAAIAVFFMAGNGLAEQKPSDLTALEARKVEFARAFAKQVKSCVERHDTGHHLFHGCIDWHSSVHGFWALTAAARVTGDEDLGRYVRETLSPDKIALEREYVNARPGFEMPYGRAWFLRLAIEFERAFGDRRLRAMADDIARSLRDDLASGRIDPFSASYESQSWALINLRAYGVHTDNAGFVDFVDQAVDKNFVAFDAPCPADFDERRRSFMAVCTNWAWLVSETMPEQEFKPWLQRFLPDPDLIVPVTHPASAHVYGLNFSRAWGLWWLYRHTGDARYLSLYRRHLEPTFDKPDWWRGPYQVVGHWVSQFGVFAIMPLFEPDYF